MPNAAHRAIAELQQHWSHGTVTLITQNVDDLHERAGSPSVLHMHGELLKIRCLHCGTVQGWQEDITPELECLGCSRVGVLRPDIVWFGEMPYLMDSITLALATADLFVAIGTSGKVYPAAGFVRQARQFGARTMEFNIEPSGVSSAFDEHRIGPASVAVTDWVAEMLKN